MPPSPRITRSPTRDEPVGAGPERLDDADGLVARAVPMRGTPAQSPRARWRSEWHTPGGAQVHQRLVGGGLGVGDVGDPEVTVLELGCEHATMLPGFLGAVHDVRGQVEPPALHGVDERVDHREVGLDVDVRLPRLLQHESLEEGEAHAADHVGIEVGAHRPGALRRSNGVDDDRPLVEPALDDRPHGFVAQGLGPHLDAEAPPPPLVGIREHLKERVKRQVEPAARVTTFVEGRAHELGLALVALVGDGLDDRFLAREVRVDRTGAEPGLALDVQHRGAVESVSEEALGCSLEDLLSTRILVRGRDAGHRSAPLCSEATATRYSREPCSRRPSGSRYSTPASKVEMS